MKRLMIAMILITSGTAAFAGAEAPLGTPIEKQWRGSYSKQEKPNRLVIKDAKTWAKTWTAMKGNMMPKPATPKIDFKKNMVIAVFMGQKSSGGYSISIKNLEQKEKLIVTVKEANPPKDSMRTMAITSPYHVVVIAKSAKRSSLRKANK